MRRRRAYGGPAVADAALMLTCVPAAQTAASAAVPAAGSRVAAPSASAWVTTADGVERLQQQAPVAFSSGGSDLTTLTGQRTSVDLPATTHARYLRVTSNGTVGNWWSLADLRLYR